VVKNSFGTKVKNGIEHVKTPQGALTLAIVLGVVGVISYNLMKKR